MSEQNVDVYAQTEDLLQLAQAKIANYDQNEYLEVVPMEHFELFPQSIQSPLTQAR